ncbi:MAG TPA: MerR family transcriptional regulator [Polyangiaceae bacterium]|nr:MerR family transcriptional regulator [Polyangiaceae bacterium]
MAKELLSIGQVAKRTGIRVKTLRFYADEGIVPPSARTASGYRQYDDADVQKLELVRTLREAGLGLPAIRAVLARDLSLADALRLRLEAIDVHIGSLRQVAAALRFALRSEPTELDIRRLTAVTHISHRERKTLIEGFYQRMADGLPLEPELRQKILANAPRLPDDPSAEQLDAWVELSELIADPSFGEFLRNNALEVSRRGLSLSALERLNLEIGEAATNARAQGLEPTSDAARALVERYLAGLAQVAGRSTEDAEFRRGVLERFERQDPRATRYWQLVGSLNAEHPTAKHMAAWGLLVEALKHHLRAPS